MESIYSYTDYKLFLKEFYDQEKKTNKFFSYQYWADHCKFKSKSYLYKVIRGDKALTVDGALRIGTFMKLKKREMNYFQAMVLFTNSKKNEEKKYFFEKLQELSKKSESSKIRQSQYEYFNCWYNAVIREIVTFTDWKGDYSILAKSVIPPISPKEAKKSVDLLLKLGFIKINSDGNYVRENKSITTGSDVISIAVNKFQKENLVLASEAIDKFERGIRDISTVTMSISEEGMEKVSLEIAAFRKRLVSIAEKNEMPDRVYQVNIQSFPLSLPGKDK